MRVTGKARFDVSTKRLVPRLTAGDIAVISHQDLDELASSALAERRPNAVVNLKTSISQRYPHRGPACLLRAGIPLLDCVTADLSQVLEEGDTITIEDNTIFCNNRMVGQGRWVDEQILEDACAQGHKNLETELERFLKNTLDHAWGERELILGGFRIPAEIPSFDNRHALVVVRGQGYREDLEMIRPYIHEIRPLVVAVDGGADALIEFGVTPDFIVGDMDSVSDKALVCGAQLVLHAYPNGRAPGRARLDQMELDYVTVPSQGTSEDVALMMCYERQADLIVAVGTHSNIIDFLDKGRPGMASTFLVRLKVGSRLVDARGISRLYRGRLHPSYLLAMIGAALVPTAVVGCLGLPTRNLLRLLLLRLLLWIGY